MDTNIPTATAPTTIGTRRRFVQRFALVLAVLAGLVGTNVAAPDYSAEAATKAQKIVQVARQQINKPYRSGKAGPSAFDCSGLVQYSVKKATGRTTPRTTSGLKNAGRRVAARDARPGDIVVGQGHAGIVTGKSRGKLRMVDAPKPGKRVTERNVWMKSYVVVRVA